MSKAYVTEFSGIFGGGTGQIVSGDEIRTQVVDFSAGVAATALPFTQETRIARVNVDATCSSRPGAAPVATTSDKRMPQDSTEYLPAIPGEKMSFIANT